MTISEGNELEMDHSGDAPARILMQPLTPQRPLTQVEQTPILKYAASVERQLPILHCDFDAPPVRKHSKPWPELEAHILYVDACDKGRWMRKSAVFGNRGPDPEISIGDGKNRLDLTLSRRIDAFFDQEPTRLAARREAHTVRLSSRCAI